MEDLFRIFPIMPDASEKSFVWRNFIELCKRLNHVVIYMKCQPHFEYMKIVSLTLNIWKFSASPFSIFIVYLILHFYEQKNYSKNCLFYLNIDSTFCYLIYDRRVVSDQVMSCCCEDIYHVMVENILPYCLNPFSCWDFGYFGPFSTKFKHPKSVYKDLHPTTVKAILSLYLLLKWWQIVMGSNLTL